MTVYHIFGKKAIGKNKKIPAGMRFADLISFLAVESRYLVPGMIIIATSKIAVTLDNCSKKWHNMSQGDEKNG